MEPPKHLSRSTRAWWRKVVAEYELQPHHFELLRLAGDALDRAEQARQALEEAGSVTIRDRFQQEKPHPAAAIERDAVITFARIVRELGLDAAAAEAPRPVPLRGNMRDSSAG